MRYQANGTKLWVAMQRSRQRLHSNALKNANNRPTANIGTSALEIDRYGLGLTRRVTHGHLRMIEGSHLFPIEHPLATAAAVDEEITRMLQAKAPGLNKA